MLNNENVTLIEKWITDILWDLNNGADILGESDNDKNNDLPQTIDKIKIKLGCILDIIGQSKKIPEGPRFNVKSITKCPERVMNSYKENSDKIDIENLTEIPKLRSRFAEFDQYAKYPHGKDILHEPKLQPDEIPGCVELASKSNIEPITKKEASGLSSEVTERLKAMLKADEIKFNKIMESFDE